MSNVYFKGDTIFLYVQFLDDQKNPVSVVNPRVRILHDSNGVIYEDLIWTNMLQMNQNEYYYNFTIPYINSTTNNPTDLGQYQIIYSGQIQGNTTYIVETFHVINKSDKYEDTVKIYGHINDIRNNIPLNDVIISVVNKETAAEEKIAQSLSNEEGYWETYLYPGKYKFQFSKIDYNTNIVDVEIGDEHNEIQFNNISLEKLNENIHGTGIFKIQDKYVTKHGIPLSGLEIQIYDIIDPTKIVASAITDKDGIWNCFLNPGGYVMKLTGTAMGKSFKKVFRIKVNTDGVYKFEDITNNIATASMNIEIGNGTGTNILSDYVKDRHGLPIVDVQVNAFLDGAAMTEENIIARDYTDIQGKWTLNLNNGNYIIEFYHPNFKTVTEKRRL